MDEGADRPRPKGQSEVPEALRTIWAETTHDGLRFRFRTAPNLTPVTAGLVVLGALCLPWMLVGPRFDTWTTILVTMALMGVAAAVAAGWAFLRAMPQVDLTVSATRVVFHRSGPVAEERIELALVDVLAVSSENDRLFLTTPAGRVALHAPGLPREATYALAALIQEQHERHQVQGGRRGDVPKALLDLS